MSSFLKNHFFLFFIIATSVIAGWQFGSRHSHSATRAPVASAKKVLFYQSPMHPWIKSDQPGNCTICGMKMVPVYEGDSDASASELVKLSRQSVTVVGVETAPVIKQPLRRTVRVAGMIDDDETAHRRLSAYIDGRVDKLFINFVGAEVTAGQPLASIYSPELLVARGEYLQGLHQTAGTDRTEYFAAIGQKLRRMGLSQEQIEALPSHKGDTFDILAPISGTVTERKVYEGQYVKAGDVLFEIGDFSKMWFVFDAYERDLAWIRRGQEVAVTTPSVPGKTFRAPIDFIDPNLVPETRSAKVRVVLDNPDAADPARHRHQFLHKLYADGRIRVETESVLTVPRTAVLSPGADPLVYVVKGEREYEPRRVVLGRVGDDVWEVLSGVSAGERVVTSGNLLIDAQAQLDRPERASAPALAAAPADVVSRLKAVHLFSAAAAVSEALASDDMDAFNAKIEQLRAIVSDGAGSFGDSGKELVMLTTFEPVTDLRTARMHFYPLSKLVANLALQWRREMPEPGRDVKVFECPMARSAVPSAETNQGRWVQASGPIRNPFFGSEMLNCGAEVAP